MKMVYEKGHEYYDFGRSEPENKGLRLFKNQWATAETGASTLTAGSLKRKVTALFTRAVPEPVRRTSGKVEVITKPGVLIIRGNWQSLAILRSLARHHVPTCIVDWYQPCISRFSRYASRFFACPPVRNEIAFLNFLRDLAVRQDIRGWLIYPDDDNTMTFVARHKKELEEYYRVPVPSWEVVQLACDKRLTYQLAGRVGIPTPKTYYPRNVEELELLDVEFPSIIKPAIRDNFVQKIGVKAVRVESRAHLIQEFTKVAAKIDSSEIMIQEFIPNVGNNLYSFGSLYRNGQVLGKVIARRVRQHPPDFGQNTTYAETVYVPELEEMATKLLRAMGYHGVSEVEFMWNPRDSKYNLIEMNARFWAWHSLAIAAGVDLPYLLYLDVLGNKVHVDGFKKGVKWFHLKTDLYLSAGQIARGRLKLGNYFSSWKGKKTFATFSWSDPLPFLCEVVNAAVFFLIKLLKKLLTVGRRR
jgi:D-aspartate ligase